MQKRKVKHVDWFMIIVDLKSFGISLYDIEDKTKIPKSTLYGYKDGSEPRHDDGELLISLWCEITENSRESVHMIDRYSYRS